MCTRLSTRLSRWRDWLPLLIILAVGATLRLYRIGELPPGLYRDEAFYGLDALGILRGHPAVFFTANNGREGLFMYLLAGSVALFGRTPEALRLTSALVGTLTILAIYFTGRNLFSHRIGILSAGVLAVTFWHVAISRVAFRAITLPLLLCLTVAFGAAAVRASRSGHGATRSTIWLALAAGVCLGLTFYTYSSAQFMLPLLGVSGVIAFVWVRTHPHPRQRPLPLGEGADFSQWERALARVRATIAFVVGVLVVLAPLLLWLMQHGDLYLLRAGQVSILSPAINHGDVLGTLRDNILKVAGMFVFEGDRIWRHNLSLRPVFDGALATAFVTGVLVSLWRVVKHQASNVSVPSLFVLLWLVIFLIPTILAEDTPHYLRAIGALPAACLLAALGLEAILAWLSRRGLLNLYFGRLRRLISPPALLAAGALVVGGVSTVSDYFEQYVHQDLTAYWLEEQNVQLATLVNGFTREHAPQSLWLEDRLVNDNPALRFLSPSVEQGQVTIVPADQPAPVVTAPITGPIMLVVDPNHDWSVLRNTLPPSSTLRMREGPLAQGDLDTAPHRAFIALQADPHPQQVETAAVFEQGISLTAVSFNAVTDEISGAELPLMVHSLPTSQTVYTVTLFWSATRPITEDYAVFVHWLRGGQVLTQHDGSPAQGYLPMPMWRGGDVIVDEHVLHVPNGLQRGDQVRVGIYRRADNTRLRVLGRHALDQPDPVTANALTIIEVR